MLRDNFKFLIVGAGRGGTSLLAGLLDYHSGLEVGFELYSVAYLMGKELPYQGSGLFHKRARAFVSDCRQEANRYPGVLWGNKITTEQVFGLEDHNLANPESKIDVLHMFLNSKVQRTGQPIEEACKRWQFSVKCYRFFKTHHSNNICVRFEDILCHPQTTLTQICDFLAVPYQEEMLKGSANTKKLPEYRHNKLDISQTKSSIDLPEEFIKRISDDLRYCSYL